jgi:hypothetical protein
LKRLALAVIATALAFPSLASAATPDVSYACTPNPRDCSGWFRSAVQLKWIWDTATSHRSGGDCLQWSERTFTADTKGSKYSCTVTDDSNPDNFAGTSVTLHIDQTPPGITGPGLARPPDFGDWFNHPVGFAFTGTDATSGIQSCSGGTYGGPDGAGVSFSGSCQDVAGNVTSGAFSINYDATPPPAPGASARPGNHRVALKWESSGYGAEVVRVSSASSRKLIYRGPAEKFTDRRLRNGHRYRYVVTLIDQAGNTASDTTSAVPTKSRLLMPADGAHLTSAPELVWKRVKRASYYNVQVRFRGIKVLTKWPVSAHFQLHQHWRSLGHKHHLARGRYCWYVWPGFGPRRLQRYGELMGVSCFRIVG